MFGLHSQGELLQVGRAWYRNVPDSRNLRRSVMPEHFENPKPQIQALENK